MATKTKAKAAATKTVVVKKATPPAPKKLARHPLSEKYGPKLAEGELAGLTDDIKAHGLHEHIIVYEGKVLAGWNRYEACLAAKVTPKFRDMEAGANPAAVAWGTNFMRRRLSSVQKAFYGAQFSIDTNLKQTDIAKTMACNLNRLNQCCQLLRMNTPEAKETVETLRDNPEVNGAQFDEYMLELGIAREAKAAPTRPARATAGGDDPLEGFDDGLDDDLTGGVIDDLDDDDDHGDEDSPDPAVRKKGKGGEIGDDTPLPVVGKSRGNKLTNPHETALSRVASAFKKLDAADQRRFVKFAWAKLRAALDEAFSHGDVEYTMPAVVVDPSLIARKKPAKGTKLDDGAKPGRTTAGSAKAKPPAKAKAKKATPPPVKAKGKAKSVDIDNDI